MHRLLILFFFIISSLHAQGEIDKKIKKTSSKIHSYSRNYSNLNRKMARTAKAILKQKQELLKQDIYLDKLKKDLLNKESSYKVNTQELQLLKDKQTKLKMRQDKLEEELVFVIAKNVSLSVVLNEEYPDNENSLIELEVLKAMLKDSKEKEEQLSSLFLENSKEIDSLHRQTSSLENEISTIDNKRKELLEKQNENKKDLQKLEHAKNSYKRELQRLLKRQNALKKTLSQLNLIKIDEIKRKKEEKEQKEAFANQQNVLQAKLPKVKKHGSSYQTVKTIRYRGAKTIAPLNAYTITKKYGTYTDPIYGIKIFNESISLRPKRHNAKVKTVFNGKVIYADKTAVLDNIVIVEHKNGLHTIYANLSQIAPNITKGQKIKKGAVIGRIDDELVFEVTKKSSHINPIQLFR